MNWALSRFSRPRSSSRCSSTDSSARKSYPRNFFLGDIIVTSQHLSWYRFTSLSKKLNRYCFRIGAGNPFFSKRITFIVWRSSVLYLAVLVSRILGSSSNCKISTLMVSGGTCSRFVDTPQLIRSMMCSLSEMLEKKSAV